jgi:hypothetical protein
MKSESVPAKLTAALEEEATYRKGLARNWTLRYGQRPDSLSRLSTIADGCAYITGAGWIALYWSRSVPHQTLGIVIGAALAGLILSHAMNRYFLKLEKLAFVDVEQRAVGKVTRHAAQASPFYPLAKIVMKPRARAKHAWVEKRTELFLARRAGKQLQAEIFEKQIVKIGSIHGTLDTARPG